MKKIVIDLLPMAFEDILDVQYFFKVGKRDHRMQTNLFFEYKLFLCNGGEPKCGIHSYPLMQSLKR